MQANSANDFRVSALVPLQNDSRLDLGAYLEVLKNAPKDMAVEDVSVSDRFSAFSANDFELWGSSSYWVRFRIDHSHNTSEHWFLTQDYEHIQQMDLYYPDDGGFQKVSSGTNYSPITREFYLRNIVFKIPVSNEVATYYLHVSGAEMMQLKLSWNTIRGVVENTAISQIIFGLFFGGLLVIFCFNLLLYFAVGNKLHLFYLYYMACMLIGFFAENGFAILFGNGRQFDYIYLGFAYLGFHAWCLFFRSFFELKRYIPWADRVLRVLQYVGLVGALGVLTFVPMSYGAKYLPFYLLVVTPIVFIIAAIRLWQGNRVAGLYIAGWFLFVPFLMWFVLSLLSIPIDIHSRYGVQFGALWESVLFTFTLTLSIRNIRASRDDALRDTVESRKLGEYTTQILEGERKAIAREIHDGFNATLITLKINLETIRRLVKDPAVLDIVSGLIDLVATRYESARSLVRRLRPELLDTLGLKGAIEELVGSLNSAQTPCEFSCKVNGCVAELDELVNISIYRITQEGTTNIIKYADATLAVIELTVSDDIVLTIKDNGRGFDVSKEKNGIGLVSIRERVIALNGEFTVHSTATNKAALPSAELPSTVLTVRIPR